MHGFASTAGVTKRFRIRRQGGGAERPALRYRGSNDPRPIGLNVVPLVDVTFLLMIFFVIAGSFDSWEGVLSSKMPAVGGRGAATAVALPVSPIMVRLTRAGSSEDDVSIAIDDFPPSPKTFPQLSESLSRIQRLPGFDAQTMVVLMADDNVRWQHVVNGWNAAVRAGYKNLAYGEPTP